MDTCFICGGAEHPPRELHTYWATADALAEATKHDRLMHSASVPSMSAVETLDPREAVWA